MKATHPHEPPLLFDWARKEKSFSRLLGSLLLTGVGFALLFFLFRIVTPDSPRLMARPQQMIVLNPNVPAERALIHRAMDQSFTLLPTDSLSQIEIPRAAKLPRLTSHLKSYQLKPKPLQSVGAQQQMPLLLAHNTEVLADLPAANAPEAKPVLKSHLKLQVEGSAAERLVSSPILKDIPLVDVTRPSFLVGIGKLGQVLMALPLGTSEDAKAMVKLHAAMTQLHFQPKAKDIEWAQISFAWEKEVSP
jgi:hypothetical protein